ncbi:MAG: FapA family protein, partial [Desulfobulbaceae bacterium]|nr:FapA family protein [Desulfobulbaceae bacterium]
VRAIGEVIITGDIVDSTVAAKGRLRIDGKVLRSKIYSQTRIRVDECGENGEPCQLLVKPMECRTLFQELLAIDKNHAALLQERQRLQNTIDLVKKLGKDIEKVSYENKVQMATDIKRFREVAGEITEGQDRKERIKKEIIEALGTNRIVILKEARPQTRITIENYSRVLDEPISKAAFFVRNMRIENAPFGE